MSDDLVARLRHAWDERGRQLDEDERVAREASRDGRGFTESGEHWQWVEPENDRVVTIDPVTDEYVGESLDVFRVSLRSVEEYSTSESWTLPHFVIHDAEEVPAICGMHIARHDPARVLAEVERGRRDIAARRRIVDLHPPRDLGRWQVCTMCRPVGDYPDETTTETWPCRTLRALAEAEGLA